MSEFNMPEGAHDKQHETGTWDDECEAMTEAEQEEHERNFGSDGPPVHHCTDCHELIGAQHSPSCHRQGLVTEASVYVAQVSSKAEGSNSTDLSSEVKSTAGPWSVGETTTQWSRCETKIHAGKGPNRGNAFCIVSGGGPSAIHSDAASVEANARLIASAPELRGLLEEVTGVIVAGYTALFPNFAFVDPPSAVERMTMEILNLRGRVEDDGEEREALAKAFDGIIGSELVARRERQDAQWGGPQHDDEHDRRDWPTYMEKFMLRADADAEAGLFESYESNMVDIAALAIAAILSSRRKRQCPTWEAKETEHGR